MKQTKRLFAVLVAVVMLLGVVPVMQVSAAYENTWTNTGDQRLDIVEVAKTQIGYTEGANNNNKYGAYFNDNYQPWCAWFVSWCAAQANISDSIIHRQGVASPFSGYFNIPNHHGNKNYFPQPGDIVFYGPNSNGDHYHVGIVETVDSSTGYITTIEGNTNSNGSSEGYIVCRQTRHYQKSNICCYGSPNYQDSTPTYTEVPSAPVVSVDKKIALVNEDVTITFSAERASDYWIGIYSDDVLWTQDVVYGNSYIIDYPYVGKYDIVVVARNNIGSASGYTSFLLGKAGDYVPENFTVSCNKKTALKNSDITFSFSADYATNYWIGVYTGGGYLYDQAVVYGNSYTTSCPWEGTYSVAIVARNECSSSETKYLSLMVVDSSVLPTVPVVSVSKKVGLINENIEISFFSENANDYWIGIYSDDVLWTQDVVSGNTYTIDYAYVGKYDIVVVARNDNGSTDGYASFRLGKQGDYVPSQVSLSVDKAVVLKNEPVTLSFSAELADAYWLGIYKDGQWLVRENIYGNSYTDSFSSTGEYSVALVAMNDCSSAETKYITFNVVDKNAFDIRYNASGGYAAPAAQSKPYGKGITLSVQQPTRTDYVFTSWNTKADGSGQTYLPGAAYSTDADLILYAMWSPCSHSWNSGEESLVATCAKPGVKVYTCSVCGGTKEETIPVNASNHVNTTNISATPSTCTAHGYTAGVYCNDCKQYISGHAEQPLAAHTLTTINQRNATCTAEGYTGDQYCTTCQQTISTGTTVGKTAHTLTVINQRDATYDAEGYTGDQYCTTCQQTITTGTAIPKLEKPTDPQPQPSGGCKWCGGTHGGAFGWLVKLFHNLFAAIFGARY